MPDMMVARCADNVVIMAAVGIVCHSGTQNSNQYCNIYGRGGGGCYGIWDLGFEG